MTLIITIIILEVEHEICGKYKSCTVSEKKAILEETKVSSTQEVPNSGEEDFLKFSLEKNQHLLELCENHLLLFRNKSVPLC